MSKYSYQDAGAIIGSGTYGIIVNPSFTCSLPQYSNKSEYVSKLIENDDLQSEYTDIISSSSLNIRELDPQSKYLIYPIERCGDILDYNQTDKSEIKSYLSSKSRLHPKKFSELNSKQAILDTLNLNYSNIIMAKAKFDLHGKHNLSKIPISHLLNGLINIIIATRRLSNHNICHRDIKPLNIVYSENTFKLIDFGLAAKKMHMVFNDDGMNRSIYQYWPLDYKIFEQFLLSIKNKKHVMNIPDKINPSNVADILKACAAMDKNIIKEMNKYNVPIHKIYNKPKNIVEMTNLIMKLIRLYQKDRSSSEYSSVGSEYKKCCHYLDTYSLAISIFQIINDYNLPEEQKDDINLILKKYIRNSYLVRGKLEDLLIDMSNYITTKYTKTVFDISKFHEAISDSFSEEIYSKINSQ